MKTRIISGILSTFLVIMFFSCKEKPKTVLYQGFVVGLNGVPVYKKPADYGHKISVLPVDAQFEVLEEKIPDPKLKDKRYWYEIRSGESRGYLSYNEVLINKNVSIFSQAGTKNVALITAKGGLNLRQKPGLKAKVIKVLPTNSLVEVIKQGSFMQAIKDKYDRWLEIKTTTGETGFIFAGYVNLYTKEEAELASKRKETQDSGYILITVDSPVYYENPGKDPINPENKEFQGEGMNYKGFPQKGEFGVVKSMVELAGKKYFKIEMVEFINYSDMYSQAMGWISADSGTYYSEEDFETYTLKNAGEFESGFINLVKTSIEGDINFTETKLTPLEFESPNPEKPNPSFYLAHIATGYKTNNNHGNFSMTQYILEKSNQSYRIISSSLNGELKIEDFDMDGIPEIITVEHGRGGSFYKFMAFIDGSYKELQSFESMGGEGELQIQDKSIIETRYKWKDGDSTPQKEVITYKYQKGKLIQL